MQGHPENSSSKKRSIRGLFLWNMILIVLASFVAWNLVWGIHEYRHMEKEKASYRNDYIASQKDLIKSEVETALSYVNHMRRRVEQRLQDSIRNRVNEAIAVAYNLYRQNKDSKPEAEIKKMIKDALRPIRFNHGRGYYFAFNLQGVEELFADRPELEGVNMLSIKGGKGEPVVKDMIEIANDTKEGFYRYTWTKPGRGSGYFPKIAFIKLFRPYGWVIGAGEYIDDVEVEIQNETINRLVAVRYGRDGYFFGSTFDGAPLFSNGKITKGTKNILNLTDPTGVKIIQEQIKMAQKPNGGFVSYSWNKIGAKKLSPKIAYVRGIPEWGWVIGAGVYVDDLDDQIAARERDLMTGLKRQILPSVAILLLLVVLILLWVNGLSRKVSRGLIAFSGFFKKAATDSKPLELDDIPLVEFEEIAEAANKMLSERQAATTALEESEAKLAESNQLLSGILDHTHMMAVFLDPQFNFLWVNRSYAESCGYEPDFFRGRNHFELYPHQENQAIFQRVVDTGEPFFVQAKPFDFPDQPERGTTHWDWSLIPVRNEAGEVNGLVLTLADVTTRVRAEEERARLEGQLRQAQKMEAIGTLAGGIAHDFNNILAAIIGYTELALEDLPDDQIVRPNLKQVHRAAIRARDMIRQILSFSRQTEHEKKPLRLEPIIEETLKLLRATIPTTIDIKQEISPNLGLVEADPTQLHQLILNLGTNAADAMRQGGGTMTVGLNSLVVEPGLTNSLAELGGKHCLRITVRDTGPGIAPEIKARIFDPFFTTKETGAGTGMGLSVVHGIVQSLGGVVTVESGLRQGTLFSVYLPAADIPAQADEETKHGPLLKGTGRVLFVDDETALAEFGELMLRRLGYQPTIRVSSPEALEAFKADPTGFDLVITDMAMPKMSGADLAVEILKINPKTPIILCTGFSDQINEAKAMEIGIRRLLNKPLSLADLSRVMKEIMEQDEPI